jgi:hypothetical protein
MRGEAGLEHAQVVVSQVRDDPLAELLALHCSLR